MNNLPSLHTRLLVVIIIPLLIVAALMSVWRYFEAQKTTEQIYDDALLSIAHVITRDIVLNQGDLIAKRLLDTLRSSSGDKLYYHILGANKPTLLSGYTPPPKPPESLLKKNDLRQPIFFNAQFRQQPVRTVFFNEYLSTNTYEGWVQVTVWQDRKQRERLSLDMASRSLIMLFIILLMTGIIVWFGVSYGLKPLRDLQDAIEKRSADELSPIKRAVPPEVNSLVTATNELFDQVENSIAEKDAFIANAAHQLRNPIAGLLSQAEAAERTKDNALLRERVTDITEAAHRTARLTQQLLSMERISQNTAESTFKTFDVLIIIRERLALTASRAYKQGTELSLTGIETPQMIRGNPLLIGEVLDNLLDNALRYANSKSINVHISTSRTNIEIKLSDKGIGIPETLLPNLFDRFTRGKEDGSGGCGLGLAICKSIMKRHGGKITITSSDKGTVITLILPLENLLDVENIAQALKTTLT